MNENQTYILSETITDDNELKSHIIIGITKETINRYVVEVVKNFEQQEYIIVASFQEVIQKWTDVQQKYFGEIKKNDVIFD